MKAGADGFIQRLEKGYDTLIGPEFLGGTDISGGQRQRLALARGFYRGRELVVLDEPTAHLDPIADHELMSRLRELLDGRTAIVISHRFANVRAADGILVMDAGRIVERGTHDELMAMSGRYAEMYRLQASSYTTP